MFFRRHVRALCLATLLAALAALPRAGWAAEVRLDPADAAAPWGEHLRESAALALAHAERRLELTLDAPVEIRTLPTQAAFERAVGERLHGIVAVAIAERNLVLINRAVWQRETTPRQQQTLVHEMTHLIIGRRVPGRLPVWLNEGLAQLVAGQNDFESAWRVMVAGTLGTLIPIERLMDEVTLGPGIQERAYAQSLSLARFYLQRHFPASEGADPAPLMRALTDPEHGAERVRALWNPVIMSSLEAQWLASHQTVWSWVAFLSGSSFLWLLITLMFLWAWWRKRRLARATRERFGEEEAWEDPACEDEPAWWEGEEEDERRS